MEKIKEEIADGSVLRTIEMFLEQGIMEGMKEWQPEEGTPQGAVISPLLANIYLNELDHKINEKGYKIVRYADDFVVLCKSMDEARKACEEIRKWMIEAGLELNNEKTRIVDMSASGAGFEFLGYHFGKTKKSGRIARWPRKKSIQKFKDSIREITRRNNGLSMLEIIMKVNQIICGWYEYFKHSNKSIFKQLDGWIRMRLRSILRKRRGRKGIGKGFDNIRWPNAYFTEFGLRSLVNSHIQECQSAKR
jgi:RNA-directed DNA polymerase